MKAILNTRLRNSEFINFHKDVVIVCNSHNPAQLHIATQVNNLSNAISVLDVAFMRNRGNLKSKELADLDERRDMALVGIRSIAEGNAHHFSVAMRQAGLVILSAMDKYGSIPHLNYLAETQVINALLTELEDSTGADAVALLSLGDWVAELRAANTAFITLYHNRNVETSGPQIDTLELRESVSDRYRELCNFIVSYSTVTPGPEYTAVLEELDGFIQQYNDLLSTRGPDEEEEEPETPTPPQQ